MIKIYIDYQNKRIANLLNLDSFANTKIQAKWFIFKKHQQNEMVEFIFNQKEFLGSHCYLQHQHLNENYFSSNKIRDFNGAFGAIKAYLMNKHKNNSVKLVNMDQVVYIDICEIMPKIQTDLYLFQQHCFNFHFGLIFDPIETIDQVIFDLFIDNNQTQVKLLENLKLSLFVDFIDEYRAIVTLSNSNDLYDDHFQLICEEEMLEIITTYQPRFSHSNIQTLPSFTMILNN